MMTCIVKTPLANPYPYPRMSCSKTQYECSIVRQITYWGLERALWHIHLAFSESILLYSDL